jgi:hypothetical protein
VVLLALAATLVAAPTPARAQAPLPVPERDPQQVEAVARRVLARPEYRPPSRSLLQRVLDWTVERVARLLDALAGGGRASVLAWTILAASVLALAVLAARFLRGVTSDPAVATAGRPQHRRTAAEWREEAEARERAGEWRLAVRCRWRGLVAAMAERGLVEEVAGRTAGEYRAAVARDLPGVAAPFAGATELFEQAWYGNRPTGPDEVARARALADRVLEEAAR